MSHFTRNISRDINELLSAFPAVIIQGGRQVGKSTLAQIIASNQESRMFTLDDHETRLMFERDPKAALSAAPHALIVIDEIQLMPELIRSIKADIDANRRPGRFLLTGSANILRVKGEPDSLAGRAIAVQLRGLSQGEFAGVNEDFVTAVASGSLEPQRCSQLRASDTRSDYVAKILRGGFPGIEDYSPQLRRRWLRGYVQAVLERDSRVLSGGSQTERISTVARLIAANQAGELVKDRIARQAGVPASSIQTYLDALDAIYLVETLRPWRTNMTSREVARRKTFVADSALAATLNSLSEAKLSDLKNPVIGGQFEAFIASELLKQQSWSATDYHLFHYRDRSGKEVDIILELDNGQVIALEVKAASEYRAEHFKGLEFLREKLGARLLAGFVVSMADHGMSAGDRLAGIPASALWGEPSLN